MPVGLAVSGTFEGLAIFANVSALALYFGCALAAWRLRSAPVGGVDAGRSAWGALTPWLAAAVIAWLFTGLTRAEWLGFGAAVAGASLVYAVARRRGRTAG